MDGWMDGRTDGWITESPSQWPRVLRHEMSPAAQTLGPLVRTPLEAGMSVPLFSVSVFLRR
jgi:hypothetical protein